MAFAANKPARHSQRSRNPCHAGGEFRGYLVRTFATACQVARPPVRIRLDRPAFGDFYFQAFNGSVSLSVAGYNYNSGWISFCWRDLHPLEWQLVSLHGQNAKCAERAPCSCSSRLTISLQNGNRIVFYSCRLRMNGRFAPEAAVRVRPTGEFRHLIPDFCGQVAPVTLSR